MGGVNYNDGLEYLRYARGFFIDENDEFYIADSDRHRIVKWDIEENKGTIVAGGNGSGTANNQLNNPGDVFVKNDTIYVADYNNHRIMRWDPGSNGGLLVAGGNGSNHEILRHLPSPRGVYVCLLYTSPSPRDRQKSRMPSSA